MIKYDQERINQSAIVHGASHSWLSFVRSKEVAVRIAGEVVRYLYERGVRKEPRHLIQLAPDHHYTGTWRVTVLLPGPGLNTEDARRAAAQEGILAAEALRAACKSGDLVSSWSE